MDGPRKCQAHENLYFEVAFYRVSLWDPPCYGGPSFTVVPAARIQSLTWFSSLEARNTALQHAIAICRRTVYHRNGVPVVSLTLIHVAGLLSLFSWRKGGMKKIPAESVGKRIRYGLMTDGGVNGQATWSLFACKSNPSYSSSTQVHVQPLFQPNRDTRHSRLLGCAHFLHSF